MDVILIGSIDRQYLNEAVEKAQKLTGKKIKYVIYESEEALLRTFDEVDYLLIWEKQDEK